MYRPFYALLSYFIQKLDDHVDGIVLSAGLHGFDIILTMFG
jgi:hypothetical protein